MVTGIWKLRLSLLVSFQHDSVGLLLRRVLSSVLALIGAVLVVAFPYSVEATPTDVFANDVLVFSVFMAIVWVSAFFLSPKMMNPRQFSSFAMKSRSLRLSLLVSSVLTWPAIVMILWLSTVAFLRISTFGSWAASIFSMLLVLALTIAGARVAAALGNLCFTPRNAQILRTIGLILAAAAVPIVAVFIAQTIGVAEPQLNGNVLDILSWTPAGAAVAAYGEAVAGNFSGWLIRILISLVTICVLSVLWMLFTNRLMSSVERPTAMGISNTRLGGFERFPARAWGVIGSRALVYWLRDPRYRVALLAIPIAPILIVSSLAVAGVDERFLLIIPIPVMLILLGWSLHNDISADSTALWSHIASGTDGLADRLGRVMPALVIGIPLVVIGSSFSVLLIGDWRILPAVIGLNTAVLAISIGVSSLFSALLPYAFTRPWDSPFSYPASNGIGAGAGAAQSLSMLLNLVLIVPVAWASLVAVSEVTIANNLFAFFFCVFYGSGAGYFGVRIGAKIFNDRSPELLTIAQSFD